MINQWKDKLAVITGASSGIGEALARKLAAQGLQVVLVARRRERLESLAEEIRAAGGGSARILTADLRREADRVRLCEQAGNADVLVNNAGLGWYGYGDQMSWKTAQEMLQVNVEAVVQLSLAFLARMRQRNAGHIINIGSISGSLPSQGIALYGATKSFLDNFTTALHRELAGTHVHVSVVRAGPVKTEFGEAALALENGGHVPTEKIGVTLGKSGRAHLEPDPAPAPAPVCTGLFTPGALVGAVLWLDHRPGGAAAVEETKTTF